MEMIGQIRNTGEVSDWKSVGFAALTWGVMNTASAFFAALGEVAVIDATGYFTTSTLSLIWGNIKVNTAIGFMGMLLDYSRLGL